MTKDKIMIENLKVYAHHGVYKEENENGQNFYINAVLYTNTRKAGLEDKLELSTNYGEVCQFIHKFVRGNLFQLIETVAEKLAEAILQEFKLIEEAEIEIRKPEAPIGLEFESVSVKISRKWHKAYLAVGSNMGDKEKHIKNAIKTLQADNRCKVTKTSGLVRTTAYGEMEQEEFLNGALLVKTLYTPEELLRKIHEIEQAEGRERKMHWGPRTLDIDIIFYDDIVYSTEHLLIPHIDMHNRDFVLEPLSQIAPYAIHPLFNKSVTQLYEEVQKTGERHVIDLEYIH